MPTWSVVTGKRTSTAVVGRHRDALAGRADDREVGDLEGDVDDEVLVGLVLDHDRQLGPVAEVQEPRRRRADLERQPGRDRRLTLPEVIGAVDRHGHHSVAGQVVGQRNVDRDRAIGAGRLLGAYTARASKLERRSIGGCGRLVAAAGREVAVGGGGLGGGLFGRGVAVVTHRGGGVRCAGVAGRFALVGHQIGARQLHARPGVLGIQVRPHLLVEHAQRIDQFVSGQDSTASSTTTIATSAPLTGSPSGPRTSTVTVVSSPGWTAVAAGVAMTSSVRVTGGIDSVI